MKLKLCLLIVFFGGLSVFDSLKAQRNEIYAIDGEKSESTINGLVKESTISVVGHYAYRTFDVEVAEPGEYFLSAWLMGAQAKSGDCVPYELIVNGVKLTTKVVPTRSNWQSIELKNERGINIPIKLISGRNKIAFVSELPDICDVEFVKISKELDKIKLDDSKYLSYIEDLKMQTSQNKYVQKKDSVPSYLSSKFKASQLPNPEANCEHRIDVSFAYTTYKIYSFSAGQQIFITTNAPTGYEHVLELFSFSNPQTYSWSNVSNSNNIASLNINIPYTDAYYVRVRAYRQTAGIGGLVSLNVNGQYYFDNCPVAGNGFSYSHTPQEVLNYFTCNNTSDPRIWISSGFPGMIVAYNDDYVSQGGNWYWGINSRVKKQIGTSVSAILISAYGSYNPIGTCDLYMGCKNSNIWSLNYQGNRYFPLLKEDDAIQSAPASSVYNCTAWAGGITSFWYWGATPTYNYGNPNYWSSWDDYFGNNPVDRYAGAQTFTTNGANADNAVIAMWALSDGTITHGSVRGYANAHPHGYDWESKPGSLMRTFHPRDALNNDVYYGYGSIVRYYRNSSGNIYAHIKQNTQSINTQAFQIPQKVYTFEESLKDGLTVVENVVLSDAEKDIVKGRNTSSPINQLYEKWINDIKSERYRNISNPYRLIETEDGEQLLYYARNNIADAILLFADILFTDNKDKIFEQNISYYMFCEIAKNRYGEIMEQLKGEWRNNNYDGKGSYIAPLPETFTKKYLKRLLNLEQKEIVRQTIDNSDMIFIYPNPVSELSTININIYEESDVNVYIMTSMGLKELIMKDRVLPKGRHSFNINYSALPLGISICTVEINGKKYIRKILKK